MKLGPRRLLVRVYLFGLMLFATAGLSQFAVGHFFWRSSLRTGPHLHIPWIVDKALPVGASAAALHDELLHLARDLGIQVSIYDHVGTLLDSTASPPLPALSADELERLRSERILHLRQRMLAAVGRFAGGRLVGYAVTAPRRPEPSPLRVILPMLLTLLVVAVASVPFARSLTQPLERLAATAREIGEGDLRVRATILRQDEVGDLARALNEMAGRIALLLRAEKELLANVSHELRTPLARIRVLLELVDSSGPPISYLSEIAEDLAELERMVDDILTTARLDLAEERVGQMKTPLRLEPTEPIQVLEWTVSRFSEHHPDRRLLVNLPHELPRLQADPAMLRRVFDNLLENAHKYSNADRLIELSAQLTLALGTGRTIEIVVRDEGIGIDAADQPRIFTPFFRSDRSRARQTGGVGLGLPLARRIVRAHGGDIELQSQIGVGTTVTVRLPVA